MVKHPYKSPNRSLDKHSRKNSRPKLAPDHTPMQNQEAENRPLVKYPSKKEAQIGLWLNTQVNTGDPNRPWAKTCTLAKH